MVVEFVAFNRSFIRSSSLLGEPMDFPQNIFKETEADRDPTRLHNALLRLIQTLERVNSDNLPDGARLNAVEECRQKIVDTLKRYSGRGKRKIPAVAECSLPHVLEYQEAGLRNLLFGRQVLTSEAVSIMGDDPWAKLRLGSLIVTTKCNIGCAYCAIDAKASGQEMDLSMLDALIDSGAMLSDSLYVGDGEIFSYSDPGLAPFLRSLIEYCGIDISITTSGLLPKNAVRGRLFIQALSDLGAYNTNLHYIVSFNLLNPLALSDVNMYCKCLFETFDLIYESGIPDLVVSVMYNGDSKETLDALDRYNGKCKLHKTPRPVGKIGRALDNDLYPPETTPLLRQCRLMESSLGRSRNKWRLGPGGDVYTACLNPGKAGSVFGNVYCNDLSQIESQREKFFRQVLPEEAGKRPDVSICEVHRTCRFRPPANLKSANPILKRKTKGRLNS